jgi:hypothetical protein
MNDMTRIAGIGDNHPPLDLAEALSPRALAVLVGTALAPHARATAALLSEHRRFLLATAAGITTDAMDEMAVDFAKEIKDEIDATDAAHARIKAPVLIAQRVIDGARKEITDTLATARAEVQRRHSAYLLAKDAMIRANAAEAANRAEEAAFHARQEALQTGEVDKFIAADMAMSAQCAAEAIVTAPVLETTRMRTASGVTSGLRDDWKYRIVNLSEVPAANLMINDKVTTAMIRSGVRHIPGLEIFNEPRAR